MNGKTAKRLRSLAQSATVGHPDVAYGNVMIGKSPTATVAMRHCTRKAYKGLKRLYKSGGFKGVERKRVAEGNREAVQE